MKICMIGTGYVGLVSGTCFSSIGHEVVCVDLDQIKVAKLRNGIIPIHEPGLDVLVAENVANGRLAFTSQIDDALDQGCNIFFIAVGTPTNPIDGSADLKYVYAAAEGIAKVVAARPGYHKPIVLVTKSTVPVGTNKEIQEIVGRHLTPDLFAVASNPEFLREGCAIDDFMKPDRIVVGSECEKARQMLEDLYRPLTRNGYPIQVFDKVETAEMIKYGANGFLALKITFANQMARLCESLGANVEDVMAGIGSDGRIGKSFLKPGPGYGGSCFPKDTQALAKTASDAGCPITLIDTVIEANDAHKSAMIDKIRDAVGGSFENRRIAVLGLAFKADTDDMRDAPSLVIVPGMMAEGASVAAYDPIAMANASRMPALEGVEFHLDIEQTVRDVDAVVILTEWPEFATLDFGSLLDLAYERVVVDLRNVLTKAQVAAMRGDYHPIGREATLVNPSFSNKVAA